MSASWPLQQAIFGALTNDAGVTALVGGRVYDSVPQDASFPYLTVGDSTVIPFDTKDEPGQEHRVVMHAWSRYAGRKEAKQILAAVYDRLNRATLTVSGYGVVLILFEFEETFLDEDGRTYHGVIRFRIITMNE